MTELIVFYRHGDIVYITYVEPKTEEPQTTGANAEAPASVASVKQDEVDDFLEKQRGLIQRKKDPKL